MNEAVLPLRSSGGHTGRDPLDYRVSVTENQEANTPSPDGIVRRRRISSTLLVRSVFTFALFHSIASTCSLFAGAPSVTMPDLICDEVPHVTDPGGNGSFDPNAHRLIDLHEITMGRWSPADPTVDLFVGDFASAGLFLRLDLVVGGLVNPPGSVDPGDFDPFRFGHHPVYGFVEIDMDRDRDTGGEVEAPQYRYLGNAVRFGGVPSDLALADRVAIDETDLDGDFLTAPFVERHGEDFHLALLGGDFSLIDVLETEGNGNGTFEESETWIVSAPWFHRAHGYEPYSFMTGGQYAGQYAPDSQLRFRHDSADHTTTLSLVFPLTNEAAGAMAGATPEPNNFDSSDQTSVLEGLSELVFGAQFVSSSSSEEALLINWEDKNASDFLNPTEWRATALLGTSYTSPDPTGEFFVWTDLLPNVIRGDVNGEDGIGSDDREQIIEYIGFHDGDDGVVDGEVAVSGFPVNFVVFDVNQDGVVNGRDAILAARLGDLNTDGDVDLEDFRRIQAIFTGDGGECLSDECAVMDYNLDQAISLKDFIRFWESMTGPD